MCRILMVFMLFCGFGWCSRVGMFDCAIDEEKIFGRFVDFVGSGLWSR